MYTIDQRNIQKRRRIGEVQEGYQRMDLLIYPSPTNQLLVRYNFIYILELEGKESKIGRGEYDTISEKDGELSPLSRSKLKRQNSPKKNKFRLPELRLQMRPNARVQALQFKKHVNDVTGVVSVLGTICSSTKNKFNLTKPLLFKEKPRHVSRPKEITYSKDENTWIKGGNKDLKEKYEQVNHSLITSFDRLAKPRFISPKMNANMSMGDYELSKLPSLRHASQHKSKLI